MENKIISTKETTQDLIKRIKRSFTIRLNRIAREEGYGEGYKQMMEENTQEIENKNLVELDNRPIKEEKMENKEKIACVDCDYVGDRKEFQEKGGCPKCGGVNIVKEEN